MQLNKHLIIVRPAVMDDLPTLLKFEQGIITTERPFDPTLKKETFNYYDIGAMIRSPDAHVAVAQHQHEIIASGYARIEHAKPYIQFERYAFCGFMYVVPEFRGKGVNQMILDSLTQWTKEKGLSEMQLQVYFNNPSAIRAYEKAGFRQHLVTMRMGIH